MILPIPEFNEHGLLPVGIHECELSEIDDKFVYNNHRKTIWSAFTSYLEQLKSIPEIDVLYVDGSYTTDKLLPADVDVIVELPNPKIHAQILQRSGQMIERGFVKSVFFTDLLFAYEPNPITTTDIRDTFQGIKVKDALDKGIPKDTRKGLLKTRLSR